MLYRIYIDETGNTGRHASNEETERFLSLSGVIVAVPYFKNVLLHEFNALRTLHFGHSVEQPVYLHRREIMSCKGPFAVLKEPEKRKKWAADFLAFLGRQDFELITVTIDKIAFYHRYPNWDGDFYHVCIFDLLERFFYFLHKKNVRGDVIAEARNKRDDDRVRAAFSDFYEKGTTHIPNSLIQQRIVCKQPKILPKRQDSVGLQLVDLLARPSFLACKRLHVGRADISAYTGHICRILEKAKYYRSRTGQMSGYGKVWRPPPKS